MEHPNVSALAERVVVAARASQRFNQPSEYKIPLERYLDPERCRREKEVLFRRYPLVLGHVSELPAPGACLTRDVCGLPVLITRDAGGTAHAFLNACRHRGTRLIAQERCDRKGLVCPYHGWSYGLDGRLLHVPLREAFPNMDLAQSGLVTLPLVERHGLIWVLPTPGAALDLDAHLGPIGSELDSLNLAGQTLFRRASARRRANWKLVAENFLEAYHVRVLHRDSIYTFFLDAVFASERVGLHMRSAVGRRAALAAQEGTLLDRVTITYFLFPNTVIVFSREYVNLMTFFPEAPDALNWQHAFLLPKPPDSQGERAHFERGFALMEGQVFESEDLYIAEEVQAGIAAHAQPHLLLGGLEEAPAWFEQTVDRLLQDCG